MTTIVLARHGRTAWHHPNRYAGRSDIPLDLEGERQAVALGRWATSQGFTALACSSMKRARDTIAPAARLTGLTPIVEQRLRELDFGIAEGRTLADVRAEDPGVVERFEADPVEHHFPGGEHPQAAVARAIAALRELNGDRTLVVAHNTLIRLITCAVLGIPLREYRRRLPVLGNVATVTLRMADPVALLAYNVPVAAGWEP